MQTIHAPEILTFDQVEKDETTRERTPVVRIGTVEIPVIKAGKRATDGFDLLQITLTDLKRIAKEGYVLGWGGKCRHIETLLAGLTKDIGK